MSSAIPARGDATLLCYKEHIAVASPSPETCRHIKHKEIKPRKCDHSSFLNFHFQNNFNWRDTWKREMSSCQRAGRWVLSGAREPCRVAEKELTGYMFEGILGRHEVIINLLLPLFPKADDEKINIVFWNSRGCSSSQHQSHPLDWTCDSSLSCAESSHWALEDKIAWSKMNDSAFESTAS